VLGGKFTVSVIVDVFEMKIKQLMVGVQCRVSYQHASSPPHQQLVNKMVTSAKSRQ
jgi:hypothetical protein